MRHALLVPALLALMGCSSAAFDVREGSETTLDAAEEVDVVNDASEEAPGVDAIVFDADTNVGDASEVFDDALDAEVGPPCDPTQTPDEKIGVFASPTGSDTTGDGSALEPFRSASVALKAARSSGRARVYLDVGIYSEQLVFVDSTPGVIVEGGFRAIGTTWKRNCAPDARAQTVLASPTAIGVLAESVKHLSGLKSLTVTTKSKGSSAPDAPGESVFGVLVRGAGSLFLLADVAVYAGAGGDGGVARSGSNGAAISCSGFACSALPTGANGPAGANGANGAPAKTQGTFSGAGFVPADGMAGSAGSAGGPGGPGGPGAKQTCVSSCTGAGGVCGGFCGAITETRSAEPGRCGCGGGGGTGGAPGRGGGASVALLVAGDSNVEVRRSLLEAGNGGAGSLGGGGCAGALGTPGTPGKGGICDTACGRNAACDCVGIAAEKLAGGVAGGAGGTGGTGGAGGGGAGGPSFAIVTAGKGTVATTSSTFKWGSGGAGAGGAPNGASGERLP